MSEASLRPSARRVLDRLRQGPATTHDLCQPDVGGLRFGARLLELREAGMEVSEERLPLPTRGSLYRLLSEPNEGIAEAATRPPCGRTMVGSGTDTYDPLCELPSGHTGSCKSSAAIDQHRLPTTAESHGGLFDAGAFHHSNGFGDAA